VEGLRTEFHLRHQTVGAVDGASFSVAPGECVGLVGESGCGKSSLARTMAGIEAPTSGEVRLSGRPLHALPPAARRRVQLLFQDPFASLDPRLPLEAAVTEGLPGLGRAERAREAAELLEAVGLLGADAGRFPHELSGGQRQRVALARALAVQPQVLVADEPLSALDASVRAQLVRLLAGIRRDRGLALLFIAHDLALVEEVAGRVAVMRAGRLVEVGPAAAVLHRPLHPYTQALAAAVLPTDPVLARARPPLPLRGDTAVPARGCPFAPRCPLVAERCRAEAPELREIAPGHSAACHLA